MNSQELANLIRFYTRTNTTTFSNSDMLSIVNPTMKELARKIVKRDSEMFAVPYTMDLVADQREYAVGDDVLNRVKKVEIKFDADDARFPSRYIKDYLGSETESEIVKEFSNTKGEFAHTYRRRAIFILSGTITAVTGGIRAISHVYPAELTDMTDTSRELEVDPSTTTFGFPVEFQEILARRVSIIWKGRQPKPLPLSPIEKDYHNDLHDALASLNPRDESGEIVAQIAQEDLGNNGWDY